jgi:hypothetical protein
MHVQPFNAHFRSEPAFHRGVRLKAGDTVAWRNPSTGEVWSGLRIDFVYPASGTVLVRGCFGRLSMRTGGDHVESKVVRMEQVTVEARAGE